MILSDIRDYLRSRRQASLADIALHVKAEPEAVRAMVEIWIKKGMVKQLPATEGCGTSCQQCDSFQTEIYVWHGSRGASTTGDHVESVFACRLDLT